MKGWLFPVEVFQRLKIIPVLIQVYPHFFPRLVRGPKPAPTGIHFRNRTLANDDLDTAFPDRAQRLVVPGKIETVRRNELFDFDRFCGRAKVTHQIQNIQGPLTP
jgi:hypothetical protein